MHIYEFLALFFIFGCFCGIKFQIINMIMLLFFIVCFFAVKLLLYKSMTKINLYYALILTVFIIGIFTGAVYNYKTFAKANNLFGTEITATGKVSVSSEDTFVMEWENGFLRVNHGMQKAVEVGDIVNVNGVLREYAVAKYNGDTDMKTTNARRGIIGYMFCENPQIMGKDTSFSISDTGLVIRNFMESRIKEFNADKTATELLIAMLTGSTLMLDEEVLEAFRKTGVSHIISVSGLHVAIFLSFFVLLTTRLKKKKLLYIFVVILLVSFYILLVGERVSVIRASIMALFGVLVPLIKRRSDSVVNLMTAGVIICIINPYYAVDIGFQLSFLSTLAIVLFVDRINWQTITVPVIVATFIYPVNLYYFNMLSVESVIVNIIVVAFAPVQLLFGYLGCFIPFLSHFAVYVTEFVIWITGWFSKIDFLHIILPSPTMHYFIAWTLLITALYISLGKQSIKRTAFLVFMAVMVCIPTINTPKVEQNSVSFINAGNYNIVHFTTKNNLNIFIDCGFDTDEYLDKAGIDEIYILVATERLRGNYKNIVDLCSTGRVNNVFLPESAKERNLQLENCKVLYYNKDDYFFEIDEISFAFDNIDNKRYLRALIYDDIITVPFNKNISDAGKCTVMCVPDNCVDGDVASELCVAKYYVHPTLQYKGYSYGDKYVTSRDGMVKFIFYPYSKTSVRVFQQEVIF